jgi:hypothetical protein
MGDMFEEMDSEMNLFINIRLWIWVHNPDLWYAYFKGEGENLKRYEWTLGRK